MSVTVQLHASDALPSSEHLKNGGVIPEPSWKWWMYKNTAPARNGIPVVQPTTLLTNIAAPRLCTPIRLFTGVCYSSRYLVMTVDEQFCADSDLSLISRPSNDAGRWWRWVGGVGGRIAMHIPPQRLKLATVAWITQTWIPRYSEC
jgi:hypothetical protein